MNDCCKYSPEKKPKGTYYWEVWQGLPVPQNKFRREFLSDAVEAWSYSRNGLSIWVPQTAINAYRQNQKTIFIATAERKKQGKRFRTDVISLRPLETSIDDAILEAKDLNREVSRYCNKKYKTAKY
jgi:hypothetical protein